MTETVTVTKVGKDPNGDPLVPGDPIVLTPLEVAPGARQLQYNTGGDLANIEYTVYFPLRVQYAGDWVDIETLIGDGDDIEIRGRRCTAMVKVWRSHSLGGAEVLARSKSGKT